MTANTVIVTSVIVRPTSFARSAVLATVVAIALAACADGSSTPLDERSDTTAETADDSIGDAATPAATSPATATSPAVDPSESMADPSQSPGQQPDGFSTILAVITEADGEVCEVCLWLADDATERGRGLMGVTDLGDAVGMAFRFDEATAGSFYMFQTPTPLSIAWFAPDGNYIGSADMDPCLDTQAGECPLYSPGESYDLAIEVFDGGLGPLGLGPGSRIELIEGSEADRCPTAS